MTIFRVGTKVRIVKRTDEWCPVKFLGRVGTIKAASTSGVLCGESLKDPFYTVAVRFVGTDGFWGEELKRVRKH